MKNAIGWVFAVVFGLTVCVPAAVLGFLCHYAVIGFELGRVAAETLDE